MKGLLFTSDARVLSLMDQVLDNFEIDTEVCRDSVTTLDAVTTTKLDTLIIDWTGSEESARVLSAMRNSEHNAKSTVLAMVNGDPEMQAATSAGANFIAYKPMNVDQATRFLRAAYGNMLLQRRRAIRCPVDIPVVANVTGTGPVEGRITDISVQGLAFLCTYNIRLDQQISMAINLPGTSVLIHVTGRVRNTITPDTRTRVGVCFSSVPQNELSLLERWISDHLS
ncbi:MAG TPA: PilZ domain-containing protein [Terriglobales bacterium]|nr:PilZ domain-containing protein [Terriglobales bacterium]